MLNLDGERLYGASGNPYEAITSVADSFLLRGGMDFAVDPAHGLHVSLGGRWEDVRRLAMPVSPRAASRLSAALEPGRCLDVLVIPSEEVSSLEVVNRSKVKVHLRSPIQSNNSDMPPPTTNSSLPAPNQGSAPYSFTK